MSKGEKNSGGKFLSIIMISILGMLLLFAALMFMFLNSFYCSKYMGWLPGTEMCNKPQDKYDVLLEEELPKMGEEMHKLREGMSSTTYLGEGGELTNPSPMGKITKTYNQGKDENGNQKQMEVEEYEGALFIRALMTIDDLSLDSIELDDEAVEKRFGYTVEELRTTSTIGSITNPNATGEYVKNEGFSGHEEVIEKLSPKVYEVAQKYDLYPSILMAQIIEESGGGNSELAKNANNLLGIKADGNWRGETYTKASKEGSDSVVTSKFKKYPSIEASIEDYGFRMQETQYMKERYADSKRSVNASYEDAIKNIASKYATNPDYENNILGIIEKYNLTKLDEGSFEATEKPNLNDKEQKKAKKIEEEKIEKEEIEVEKLNKTPTTISESGESPKVTNPLKGTTIVLDPGHGGHDGGAPGQKGYHEKNFNLDVGLAMKSRLEALGATVIMTRTGDTYPDLGDRPKMAINNNADMFISIHANSTSNKSTQGTETLYRTGKDKELAIEIQKHMLSAWGLKDRGIVMRDNLRVLNGLQTTTIPAVLIEPGFMQDPSIFDSHFLNQEMRDRLTIGLIAGIMSYKGLELTEEMEEMLGEIPPSVRGSDGGETGPTDSHLSAMGRKHNNFLTAWMMARTLEEEYKKHKEDGSSDIGHVFDDVIDGRAVDLVYDRRDWLMTVQSEAYSCFFIGDKYFRFGELIEKFNLEAFNRTPCKNLDDVYEKTFGEKIEFIPSQYQAIVGKTDNGKVQVVSCDDGSTPTNNGEKDVCADGGTPTYKEKRRETLLYPEVGDILGQFGLFTIYLPGVTVYDGDDTYVEYLEERILRDVYGLEYNISAISMINGENSCVNTNITPGSGQLSEAVKGYAEPIKKELDKYGLANMMPILLGIMQQESGGKLSLDVMQASESVGRPPNSIKDPQESIQIGVKHFYNVYTKGQSKGVDLQTIIQSYNMGGGYIDHVAKNGGKHTVELAKQFSDIWVAKKPNVYNCGGNTSNFRYPHCYGDFSYTDKVMSYISAEDSEEISSNSGTNANPCMMSSEGGTYSGDGAAIGSEGFQKIFAAAEKYKGTKYSYGGTDPYKGIDCSAFMQVIYKEGVGKTLPRTAQMQYNATTRINKEELTPGDLIFFQTNGRKVGHVGVYIGNGKMYHSGSTYGVSTVDVFKGYWAPLIVGYGRI